MRQAVEDVAVVFDVYIMFSAVAYVALSTVSSLHIVVPLLPLRRYHFINIDY